jgi:hypothetical protein
VVLLSLLILAASCTGGTPPSRKATSSASIRPSPTPAVLERLVLTADLSEAPAAWQTVFFVPFGKRSNQLGFKRFPESVNSQPSSFAVAADGSFLIMDRWKERVARYSAEGEFLGATHVGRPPAALSVGSARERVRDIVVSADRTYALMEPTGGPIVEVRPDGSIEYLRPRLENSELWVAEVFPSQSGVVMLVGGFVESESGFVEDGPQGFFRFRPPGLVEPLPGLPAEPGRWIDLQRPPPSGGDQDFELRFAGPGETTVQPFRVEVRTSAEPEGRSLGAVVGPGNLIPAGGDVVMYVMVSPSRPADAARYGGGRWLLRLGRSPVLWERLPEPAISDETQARHLALGSDGTIYLMVAQKGGVVILRRP